MQKLGRSNEWISLFRILSNAYWFEDRHPVVTEMQFFFRILSNAYWLPDRHRVVTQMQKTHNAKIKYVGTYLGQINELCFWILSYAYWLATLLFLQFWISKERASKPGKSEGALSFDIQNPKKTVCGR